MSGAPETAGAPAGEPAATLDSTSLDGAGAHLLAWVALALVNAAYIARLPLPPGGIGIRALHHLYDAGHLIAVGLLFSMVSDAWRRWVTRRPLFGYLALAAASIVVGHLAARESLRGYAEQLAMRGGWTGEGEPEPYLTLLTLGLALTVPCALFAGRLIARPRLRWIGVGLALAIAVGNELVLESSYSGGHFYFAWCAASMGAGALTGATLPAWWTRRSTKLRKLSTLIARAVAAPLAALTVIVWPASSVLTELWKLDGAILLPILARAQDALQSSGGNGGALGQDRPDVPPSRPRLIPADGIVILITADSVRRDVIEDDRLAKHVPNLRRMRDEGLYFTMARATAAGTRLTMAGIFAGRLWSQLPWTNPSSGRPVIKVDPSPRLPELLAAQGVRTATFVSEHRALINEAGIVRGFQEQTVFPPRSQKHARDHELAPKMIGGIIDRLKHDVGGPMFVFAHLMDPHYPYDAGGTDCKARECYYLEIALVDEWIGKLRDAVAEAGLADRTTIIFASDHGEAFGQHNTQYHNDTLYEELVRVPLIIYMPNTKPRVVDSPVSTIDLGPTILDLMGVVTPGVFMGESLVPYLRGQTPQHQRPIVAETPTIRAMVTPDGFKVIHDLRKRREEIYDLNADPDELRNIRDELGEKGDRMQAELAEFFRIHAPDAEALATKADEEAKRAREQKLKQKKPK